MNKNRSQSDWPQIPPQPLGTYAPGFVAQPNFNRCDGMTGNVLTAGNYLGTYPGNQPNFQHLHNPYNGNVGRQFGQEQSNFGRSMSQFGQEQSNFGKSVSQNPSRNKLCRNGQNCNEDGCNLHHSPIQKKCRNGNGCANRESTCLFMHDTKN